MTLYRLDSERLREIKAVRFADARLREREDLQRYLRDQVEVLDPELFVVAEEFGSWEEGRRRIDLVAIDRDANLVVIELKRTEDGGHMELQAIRYAAMVANMTFEQLVTAHASYLVHRGIDDDAETRLLGFLGWDEAEEDLFGQEVRIVLVSADFSRELTTSVLWLNDKGLDIRCVRLRPHQDGEELLLDVQQIIPLPEAQDYVVGVREKRRKEDQERHKDYTKFNVTVDGVPLPRLAKRQAVFRIAKAICDAGVSPEDMWSDIPRSFSTVWRVVEGTVGPDEFIRKATEAQEQGGPVFDLRRWFTGADELIVSNDNTYAFTKMWGRKTESIARLLVDKFGGGRVHLERAE